MVCAISSDANTSLPSECADIMTNVGAGTVPTGGTKPRRAIRPCDSCRKKKTRCVMPSGARRCTVCCSRNLSCTFEERPPVRSSKNRRLESSQEGQPAPALDILLPVHTDSRPAVPELPLDLPSLEPPFQRSESRSTTGTEHSTEHPNSNYPGHYMTPQASTGRVFGQCTEKNSSLGLANFKFAELYGLSSDMEPILMRHRPYDRGTQEYCLETHRIRRVQQSDMGMDYPLTFHIADDSKAVGYQHNYLEHDTIEKFVAPYGPSLVRLFWKIVHPCYPIVYKRDFMEKYSRSYREVAAPLLGAVYLISINWWSYDHELSNKPPPNAAALRRDVIKAIQNSHHRPRLSSVEATLLLLQCKPEDSLNPDHSWTWGFTGQGLSISQALGLHLDPSTWTIPRWEIASRKRLSWAIYMQDKWTALMHGRPSHIHDDDWAVEDLSDSDFADFEDETQTDREDIPSTCMKTGKEVFVRMVTLTQFLSEILTQFYSVKASRGQDTVDLHQRAVPILSRLNAWYQSFPPTLTLSTRMTRRLSASGFLHLSYHGTMLTLLRRVIRSTALAPLCCDITVLNETRSLASDAAVSAASFVQSLRPDHLEAFWFFQSGFFFSLIGSFLTLLLVTSRSDAEKNHWRESLNDYLWTLRIMGKASEPIQYAVNRLEGAILRGMEHALSVTTASYPRITPTLDYAAPAQTLSQQPDSQPLSPGHQFVSVAADISNGMAQFNDRPANEFFAPFIGEDLTNLDLGQFDWLSDL